MGSMLLAWGPGVFARGDAAYRPAAGAGPATANAWVFERIFQGGYGYGGAPAYYPAVQAG